MTTLLPADLPLGDTEMKRADQRSSINILVLGDSGVGKSSLISTFVSRYFSPDVPGIMARVRLPPDPGNSCITTIIDSQGGDAAFLSAVGAASHRTPESSLNSLTETAEGIVKEAEKESEKTIDDIPNGSLENIDSIVLAYDLDRADSFSRLERHWLPLIEAYYKRKVPVIVAENKMDLFTPSSSMGILPDEHSLARKRQQIVSLMQQFPFVRQCIKCSAKTLVQVDDVFLKAQQAVIYPFTPPLYDLETGKLTPECQRALVRIFRSYDRDRDGLLSDAELDRFQRETYHSAVFDRDFTAWKKVVTRHASSDQTVVLQEGKFTEAGFLAIFDVFISQNRLDVVWQALREYHYDDDLKLHIPRSVIDPFDFSGQGSETSGLPPDSWKLTPSARKFLAATFYQFDSDNDGRLSAEDLSSIFSVLPPPSLPPWMRHDYFEQCFSRPRDLVPSRSTPPSPIPASSALAESTLIAPSATMEHSLSNSGLSILSASDSLPSVDLHPGSLANHKPLTFLEWMGLWHTVAAISPAIARSELFRLGHIENYTSPPKSRRGKKKEIKQHVPQEAYLKSREIRILALGSSSAGKTAMVQALCRDYNGTVLETPLTPRPETTSTFLKLRRGSCESKKQEKEEEFVVHLVFTDVPERNADVHQIPPGASFDLALLVFESTLPESLAFVKNLESELLASETPRVFLSTKADLTESSELAEANAIQAEVLSTAAVHCRELDIEAPLVTSPNIVTDNEEERMAILDHITRSVLHMPGVVRLRSRPHEEQKRRDAARRRKMMWFGGIVSVGVVVAVGMGLLWGSGAASKTKHQKGGFGWFRSWFGGGSSVRETANA